MRCFSLIVLALLLAACGRQAEPQAPEPDPASLVVMKVRGTDRLYTTEYVVRKIVTYDDIVRLRAKVFDKDYQIRLPQGDRKVLIPMEARVKAYVDFSGFGPGNVVIGADSTVTVTLPDPRVVLASSKIDHRGVMSIVDFGRSRFTSAELAELERQGRQAIIASIPDMGILATARASAYQTLAPMIAAMGYSPDKIRVDFRSDLTNDDLYRSIRTLND